MKLYKILLISLIITMTLSSCATLPAPPNEPKNICYIFHQYSAWYWQTSKVRHIWHVPISVQMAIMYYESGFNAHARPKRKYLGFIPLSHISSAYGYSQALTGTWYDYEKDVGKLGRRDNFNDATNFIGWYANQANKKARIRLTDSYHLYLAYHEGINNYLKHSYYHKPWLIKKAMKVKHLANSYRYQLLRCEKKLATH